MILSRKLQKWASNGYITPDQALQISTFEQKNNAALASRLLYWLAGLFIGLGTIMVVSANWSHISDTVKLIGDFFIWFALIFSTSKLYNKKSKLTELFFLLCFLFTGASIGLIAQIFHLNGGWHSFAGLWALLSLPFILFSKSKILNSVWLTLLLISTPEVILDWLTDFLRQNILGFVICYSAILGAISWISHKIDQSVHQKIILFKVLSDFLLFLIYAGVLIIGIFESLENSVSGFLCLLYAFAFLGGRLIWLYRVQNINSFTRNIYITEAFIVVVFLSRWDKLLTSGLGFIAGGCALLIGLYVLKRTSKYIKKLRISNE